MGRTPTTRGAGAVSGGDLQRLLLHEFSFCNFPPVVNRAEWRRRIESPESPLRHHQYPPDQRRRVRDLLELLRRVRPQAHRRERRLDHVRRAQVLPVFGGEVEEGEQRVDVLLQGNTFGYLAPYAVANRPTASRACSRVSALLRVAAQVVGC